jgi:hypothetical protein
MLSARPALRALPAVLASCVLCAPAAAQDASPYYIGVTQTFTHDTNLLRLTTNQAAPAGLSKSDTVSSTALIAGLDQPIGRQRLYGNLSVRANRFDKNRIYDNEDYTLSAGLDFATIERISGSLFASANRGLSRLNSVELGLLTDKNLESTETYGGVVRVGVVTRWTFELSGNHRRVDNSLDDDRVRSRNFRQDTASAGVRWRPSPDLHVGLAARGSRGTYPEFRRTLTGFQADRFEREDVDLTVFYRPSGLSQLNLRLSNGKTEYDLATQRNFSGVTGKLDWRWQATGKVTLSTSYARDTGQDTVAGVDRFNLPVTSDYSRVTDRFALRADWAATAKLAFDARVAHGDSEVVRTFGSVLVPIPVTATGREKTTTLSLGGRWAPVRWAQLGCGIDSERRNGSGTLGTDLRGETYSCYGRFTLQ